ncbi:MAG: hypothetical protein KDA41_21635, partial [Planctomycetales bacterium]|nr:hypothetical protein [Planctomycetales bacterium]
MPESVQPLDSPVSTLVAERAEDCAPTEQAEGAVDTARVLHIINGEHYSGAERVQDLLALRLPQFGYEVGFALIKPGKFIDSRSAVDARLHVVPMANKFDLRVVQALVKLVRDHGYRILHAHTPRTAMVGRLAAA